MEIFWADLLMHLLDRSAYVYSCRGIGSDVFLAGLEFHFGSKELS